MLLYHGFVIERETRQEALSGSITYYNLELALPGGRIIVPGDPQLGNYGASILIKRLYLTIKKRHKKVLIKHHSDKSFLN